MLSKLHLLEPSDLAFFIDTGSRAKPLPYAAKAASSGMVNIIGTSFDGIFDKIIAQVLLCGT